MPDAPTVPFTVRQKIPGLQARWWRGSVPGVLGGMLFGFLAWPGLTAAPVTPLPAGSAGVEFRPPPEILPGAERRIYRKAGEFELPLYVFRPAAKQPTAALLFFHGSGWYAGAVSQFAGHARDLAAQGLCAAVVEYRVKQRYDATPFDGASDVRAAIRWFRQHANEWNVDPRRIGVAGGSAGAHLALCAALVDEPGEKAGGTPVSSRPDLLVLFAVPTDTTTEGESATPSPWFGGRERELSPVHLLRRELPPMQIFQGTADRYVPADQTRRFVDAAVALGDTCDLLLFEGRGHGFYNHPDYYREYPGLPSAQAPIEYPLCSLLMSRFLRDHGFLEGPTIVPQP
ncbi:MAG: alpha/beta hydrolase [Opitutaceae bacterium]